MTREQRIAAEREWMDRAQTWAVDHPGCTETDIVAALPNPDGLLVRALAGGALSGAQQKRHSLTEGR